MPSFKINHVISVWISNLYISLFYKYKMFMKSVNSVNSGHPSSIAVCEDYQGYPNCEDERGINIQNVQKL